MDGAAHLYNSNILLEMLSGNALMDDFYMMNSELVPNWSGHFFLMLFNSFLPAYLAEKVFLLIYFIGLPLSFRYFLRALAPKSNAFLMSYFIFPFTYSFMMMMGFYNFSMAILFFFLSGAYWFQNKENLNTKKVLLFSLLLLATYFSHLVVFGLLLIALGMHLIIETIATSKPNIQFILKAFWNKSKYLLIASAIPLILAVYYFFSRSENTEVNYLEFRELVDWLKNLRALIIYHEDIEGSKTKKIVYLFATLLIVGLFTKFNRIELSHSSSLKEKIQKAFSQLFNIHDTWLLLSFVTLILYFKLPDGAQGAGFISVRLSYIFYLFLLIWLALQSFPKWFIAFNVICLLYFNYKLNDYYTEVTKDLNKVATACYEMGDEIEENSIVLPINRGNNWLFGHFSNYLGAEKPMIILENYEASVDYFPLKYNWEAMPNLTFGDHPIESVDCLWWPLNNQKPSQKIPYVFILGRLNSDAECDKKISSILEENYQLIKENDHCQLYKLRD